MISSVSASTNVVLCFPKVVMPGQPAELIFEVYTDGKPDALFSGRLSVRGLYQSDSGAPFDSVTFDHGRCVISEACVEKGGVHFVQDQRTIPVRVLFIPPFLSLLPPFLAILLAILFRQVLIALFAGIWLGAFFLGGYNPGTGLLRALDQYVLNALADPDHAAVVIFSMMLGGMVGILTRSGGTHGIVKRLSHWADHPRRGQLAAWGMGLLIFFDDYANTLIVGNTLRPVTDRLKISREKLSYIVDATAAPVVSIAIFSTWIGFELGLLQEAFQQLGIQENVYWFYIQIIPYRFYSLLTLLFVLGIALTGRDFGPMLRAERRARTTGKTLSDEAMPLFDEHADMTMLPPENERHARNAIVPILVVIAVTMLGLLYNGRQVLMQTGTASFGLRDVIGAANPFSALLWSSFAGCLTAALLAVSQRILNIRQTMDAWIAGVKSMTLAMLVIVLAWGIGQVCKDLHTAETVVRLTHGFLSPQWLPMMTFIMAGLISFATGTSWGTLSILIPIVTPVAWAITRDAGFTPALQQHVFIGSIASVLAGATFGDHCSPISDTTIMSSMASGADHIDHVRTQIPYALVVAGIAVLVGYIPAGFGLPAWISLIAGIAAMAAVLKWVARPVGE